MTPQQASPDRLTVRAALDRGTHFLRSVGADSPRLEMELILAEAMALERLDLYLNVERRLTEAERTNSRSMLARRKLREPLAYILGRREFYGLEFTVTRDVLIPRPETELLVDGVLEWIAKFSGAEGPLLADLGTGSGAVAVAAAATMKTQGLAGRWIATDVSEAALEIARANAALHGVEDRIDFRLGAMFEPFSEPVDCLCSNPPYVAEDDSERLEPEVADWEPPGALFSGAKGMEHTAALIGGAGNRIAPGGALFVEIGAGRREEVERLLQEAGAFGEIAFHRDHAGLFRVAEARRSV